MQSLINIMECQLEEAFEAAAATGAGAGAGSRKQSISKRKASVVAGVGDGAVGAGAPLNPKVIWSSLYMRSLRNIWHIPPP